jgi:hypothetical protein
VENKVGEVEATLALKARVACCTVTLGDAWDSSEVSGSGVPPEDHASNVKDKSICLTCPQVVQRLSECYGPHLVAQTLEHTISFVLIELCLRTHVHQ